MDNSNELDELKIKLKNILYKSTLIEQDSSVVNIFAEYMIKENRDLADIIISGNELDEEVAGKINALLDDAKGELDKKMTEPFWDI